MPIVPHQTPTLRSWPVGVSEPVIFVEDPDRDDGLEAARGIVIAFFISIVFWIILSLIL